MHFVSQRQWSKLFACILCMFTASGFAMEPVLERLPKSRLRDNVIRTVETFRVKEDQAKLKFMEAIRDYEEHLKFNGEGLASAERLQMTKDVKKWLNSGGLLPRCDELFPALIEYRQSVAKARVPVVRPTLALIQSLQSDGEKIMATVLTNELDRLGDVLNTSFSVKPGSKWAGHRKHAQNRENEYPLRFTIDKRESSHLLGSVERSYTYRGHPKHQFIGRMDGAIFHAATGKRLNLQGREDGTFQYTGYVIGRTIIGEFSGRQSDGKPGSGYFRVDLVD